VGLTACLSCSKGMMGTWNQAIAGCYLGGFDCSSFLQQAMTGTWNQAIAGCYLGGLLQVQHRFSLP
jgi:hypothetical protein